MSKLYYILLKLVKVCVTTDSTALQKSVTQSNDSDNGQQVEAMSQKNLKQVNRKR